MFELQETSRGSSAQGCSTQLTKSGEATQDSPKPETW